MSNCGDSAYRREEGGNRRFKTFIKKKRLQCMQVWEDADREVKSKQLELFTVEADTTRLQESIDTLLALPEKCSNLIDDAFNNERLVFGKLPPIKKIFM